MIEPVSIFESALSSCEMAGGCILQSEEEDTLLDFSLLQTSLQVARRAMEQHVDEHVALQAADNSTLEHGHNLQTPVFKLVSLLSHSSWQSSVPAKVWVPLLGVVLGLMALLAWWFFVRRGKGTKSDSESKTPAKIGVYGILITQTLNALATMVVMPTMPFYAMQIGANAFTISLMGSAYNLAQMFCSPLLGNISDRFGRKRVMLVGIVGQVLCNFSLCCAHTPHQLLLARVAVGVAMSTGPVEMAYIMDYVKSEQELSNIMSLQKVMTSAGALAGPAVARSFANLPFTTLCRGVVAINILNFFIGCMLWQDKKSAKSEDTTKTKLASVNTLSDFQEEELLAQSAEKEEMSFWQQVCTMFRNPSTCSLLLVSCAYAFSFGIGEGPEMVFFKDRFAFSKDESCVFFMCINVSCLICAAWVPALMTHMGALNVCLLGSFGGCLATLTLVFGPQKSWVPYSFGVLLVGLCGTMVGFGFPHLVRLMCPEELRGTLLGLQHSLNGGAGAVAPPLGGILYSKRQTFPFIASSLGLGLTGMLYETMRKQPEAKEIEPAEIQRRRTRRSLTTFGQPMYNDKLFMVQVCAADLRFELDDEVRDLYERFTTKLQEQSGKGGMPIAYTVAEGLAQAVTDADSRDEEANALHRNNTEGNLNADR